MLILAIDKLVPWLLGVLSEDVIIVGIESHIVLVDISIELISSEDLGNLHQLIVIVLALEEWFLLEDHTNKHAAK